MEESNEGRESEVGGVLGGRVPLPRPSLNPLSLDLTPYSGLGRRRGPLSSSVLGGSGEGRRMGRRAGRGVSRRH